MTKKMLILTTLVTLAILIGAGQAWGLLGERAVVNTDDMGNTTTDNLTVNGNLSISGTGVGMKYPGVAEGVNVSRVMTDGTTQSVFIGRERTNGGTTFTLPEFGFGFVYTNSLSGLPDMDGSVWAPPGVIGRDFELSGLYSPANGDANGITLTSVGRVYDLYDTDDISEFSWGSNDAANFQFVGIDTLFPVTPTGVVTNHHSQPSYYAATATGQVTDTKKGAFHLPVAIDLTVYDEGAITTEDLRLTTDGSIVPWNVSVKLESARDELVDTGVVLVTIEEEAGTGDSCLVVDVTHDTTGDQQFYTDISHSIIFGLPEAITTPFSFYESGDGDYPQVSGDAGFYFEFKAKSKIEDGTCDNNIKVVLTSQADATSNISFAFYPESYVKYTEISGQTGAAVTVTGETTDAIDTPMDDAWRTFRLEFENDGDIVLSNGGADFSPVATYDLTSTDREASYGITIQNEIAAGYYGVLPDNCESHEAHQTITKYKDFRYGRLE